MIYFTDFFNRKNKEDFLNMFKKNKKEYKILRGTSVLPTSDDVLFSWNRFPRDNELVERFYRAGAKVVIMENPYIPIDGFSVGLWWHNNWDFSVDCMDSGERFQSLGHKIEDWKTTGEYILVTTQAKKYDQIGMGHYNYRQPSYWDTSVLQQLSRMTDMPIFFKPHPNGSSPPIEKIVKISRHIRILSTTSKLHNYLDKAYCTIVHSSNSATESLLKGIPVIRTGDYLFSKNCMVQGINNLHNLYRGDNRENMFNKMAWNQFTYNEVENGYFFKVLDI